MKVLGELEKAVETLLGGSRGGGPPLFWVKKEEMTEGEMADRAPRAHDPSGLWQRSRALVWSNTGSPRFTDFPSNQDENLK